jgi:hypothetical protein
MKSWRCRVAFAAFPAGEPSCSRVSREKISCSAASLLGATVGLLFKSAEERSVLTRPEPLHVLETGFS